MSLHMITRMFAGVLIVECSGRLVIGEESANLRHLVRDHLIESKQVVLDLGKVSYIDSSGLGILVGLYSTATKVGGGIKLANLNPGLEDKNCSQRLEGARTSLFACVRGTSSSVGREHGKAKTESEPY
jgi:anti-sigma B factor antagonist